MEANFVRKIKKGKGKYKEKLPFKCFNRSGVGYFIAKCPLKGKNKKNNESYRENGIRRNHPLERETLCKGVSYKKIKAH